MRPSNRAAGRGRATRSPCWEGRLLSRRKTGDCIAKSRWGNRLGSLYPKDRRLEATGTCRTTAWVSKVSCRAAFPDLNADGPRAPPIKSNFKCCWITAPAATEASDLQAGLPEPADPVLWSAGTPGRLVTSPRCWYGAIADVRSPAHAPGDCRNVGRCRLNLSCEVLRRA